MFASRVFLKGGCSFLARALCSECADCAERSDWALSVSVSCRNRELRAAQSEVCIELCSKLLLVG